MARAPLLKQPILDGIRAVAVFEAAKGGLVLLAGLGLLNLLHRDAQALAERLVRFSHLNPASKYPQIFIEAAAGLNDARLWWLAAGAGGLYVPVELYHLAAHFSWLKVAVLATNLAVVAYMAYALRHRAEVRRELGGGGAKG
jgi:uncharacterized membrane protein (DUF2068 family)